MYTKNLQYKNSEQLKKWLDEFNFASQKECLVQVFFGVTQKSKIETLLLELKNYLPLAHVIGATTDGEIYSNEILEKSIVISVTVFEKSTLGSSCVEYTRTSFDMGKAIAHSLQKDNTKALILLTTGLEINGELFLDGVREIIDSDCVIAGGMAGDNGEFSQTYVVHNSKVISKGAVGVVISGEHIQVDHSYEFGWSEVGLPMRVTKSIENRVYELDGVPIIEVYKKYFGENISNELPKIGVEIPLMLRRDGKKVARACIKKFDDNSLLYAGNLDQNEEVRFGLGIKKLVLNSNRELCSKMRNSFAPQTMFIYSCMARRRLLENEVVHDIDMVAQSCSPSGFFTYGEFYSDGSKSYLFNETMTILRLSESLEEYTQTEVKKNNKISQMNLNQSSKMMAALTHMTNVIAKEWQEKVDREVEKNKIHERENFQKNKLAQMGEMIGMIAHQWRQPLNAISASAIKMSLHSSMDMLDDKHTQKDTAFIQEQCQKMSATINTFMNFVKPAKKSAEFTVADTLASIMELMGTQLMNHNIEVNIANEDNISVVGYQDLLEQVIINILSNARDAFDELNIDNKKIDIKVFKEDEIVIIRVEDNAGGIPEEIREKIFNPYFTTKEEGKGTGIGLYMSIDIMKKSFNGNLLYEATAQGSAFILHVGGGKRAR